MFSSVALTPRVCLVCVFPFRLGRSSTWKSSSRTGLALPKRSSQQARCDPTSCLPRHVAAAMLTNERMCHPWIQTHTDGVSP